VALKEGFELENRDFRANKSCSQGERQPYFDVDFIKITFEKGRAVADDIGCKTLRINDGVVLRTSHGLPDLYEKSSPTVKPSELPRSRLILSTL